MLSGKRQRMLIAVTALLFTSLVAGAPKKYVFTMATIKARKPDQPVPAFVVAGPVEVVTTQAPRIRWFKGWAVRVDYRQLAETAVKNLNAALDRNEPNSTAGEPKSLVYAISSIDCLNLGGCFINFTIRTGDGNIRGFMTDGKAFLPPKKLSKAAANTPVVVFADPLILEYLAR